MGMLKKAYAQAKNLDTDTSVDSAVFTKGGSAMKHVATEGHSPHKKGTKKYKAHMAAMHANSAEPQGQMIETKEEKPKTVTLENMRSALELDKDTTSLDIVSNYVKTTLDETFDTWPKVRQQVDYILSRVSDTNAVSSDEVFDKVFKENLQSQLDEQVMVSENIDTLRDIVNNKSVMTVKFQDGSMKVDMTTANIFLQAYDKMKESNQEKISEMMKTKKGFLRVLDFIYGAMK
jgi:ribosome-binding factor A